MPRRKVLVGGAFGWLLSSSRLNVNCGWADSGKQHAPYFWLSTLVCPPTSPNSRRPTTSIRVWRRELSLPSSFCQHLTLDETDDEVYSFLFNCMFSFTYTPLQGVIPAEALETTMRAKGLALSGIIVSATDLSISSLVLSPCRISRGYQSRCIIPYGAC